MDDHDSPVLSRMASKIFRYDRDDEVGGRWKKGCRYLRNEKEHSTVLRRDYMIYSPGTTIEGGTDSVGCPNARVLSCRESAKKYKGKGGASERAGTGTGERWGSDARVKIFDRDRARERVGYKSL